MRMGILGVSNWAKGMPCVERRVMGLDGKASTTVSKMQPFLALKDDGSYLRWLAWKAAIGNREPTGIKPISNNPTIKGDVDPFTLRIGEATTRRIGSVRPGDDTRVRIQKRTDICGADFRRLTLEGEPPTLDWVPYKCLEFERRRFCRWIRQENSSRPEGVEFFAWVRVS